MSLDLPMIWAAVIIFGVVMYVILDGFDLGLGVLFPFAPDSASRDTMMASVAPVWDGNETWLVLGGAALFAAFPTAFSILLPALYLPLMAFLLALVFRGVAFEFRHRAYRTRAVWTTAFAGGSLVAAFAQGLILGAFVQGLRVEDGQFAGGLLDWLTPFSIVTGLALVVGYALLGACWLIVKTEGALQAWSFRVARRLTVAIAVFILVVSAWTPLLAEDIVERWFSWPGIVVLAPIPVITALVLAGLWQHLGKRREATPFPLAILLFLLCFLGLAVSLWPYAVPREVTIAEAAASETSQMFLLIGVVLLLPVILAYTLFTYRVFRGKVRPGEGYH